MLVLYFGAENVENELLESWEEEAIGETYIEKMVEMPVVPRIDELIVLGGNTLRVDNVQHVINKRAVEVDCNTDLSSGVAAYAEDKEGWNLDYLKPAGKELLLTRVKKFEEGRRKDRR
jgi:hypothetical protein